MNNIHPNLFRRKQKNAQSYFWIERYDIRPMIRPIKLVRSLFIYFTRVNNPKGSFLSKWLFFKVFEEDSSGLLILKNSFSSENFLKPFWMFAFSTYSDNFKYFRPRGLQTFNSTLVCISLSGLVNSVSCSLLSRL